MRNKVNGIVLTAICLLLLLPATVVLAEEKSDISAHALKDQLRYGEKMYREGVLPSGKPMQAFVQGDVPVSGTSFTCISCHLRSGMGSVEGTIVTPPTNGRILYQERKLFKEGFELVPNVRKYSLALPMRPAYTDDTLADCIAGGVDPTGRKLNNTMPVYHLEKDEMAALIAYLKSLSNELPPGVSEKEIRFATVITEDVRPEDSQAMLLPIEEYIKIKNGMPKSVAKNPRSARMAVEMLGPDLFNKKLLLSKWVLKGNPETWREQLEAYYRKEPVFALLGGISNGDWQPVHAFCEAHGIPNLFPVTDIPVLAGSDWYTSYFTKGISQEGEAAARYLNSFYDLIKDRKILKVVRDSRGGAAISSAFDAMWSELGHPAVQTVTLASDAAMTGEYMKKLLDREKPSVLLIWDDSKALPALGGLLTYPNRPEMVLMSSGLLGTAMREIPESLRSVVNITYPYRLPQDDARFDPLMAPLVKGKKFDDKALRILKQSFDLTQIFSQALMDMRGEFYRDFLLDAVDMMADRNLPLFERLSFGPGQRYASKGCYIVQLGKGAAPELIRKSDWVIH